MWIQISPIFVTYIILKKKYSSSSKSTSSRWKVSRSENGQICPLQFYSKLFRSVLYRLKNKIFKGTTVIRNCAAGLLFNSNYNYCDWPANVQCGSNGGSSSTTASTSAATSNVFKIQCKKIFKNKTNTVKITKPFEKYWFLAFLSQKL